MTNVLISGGGRTGHLYSVLLKQRPDVRVLWHTRKAQIIKQRMPEAGIQLMFDEKVVGSAIPDAVGSDFSDLAPEADVIIFTQTANGRPDTLKAVGAHIPTDRPVYVGAIPACGGFDWLVDHVLGQRDNVVVWGLLGVPATSPRMDPGCSVQLGGFKDKLYLGFAEGVSDTLKAKARTLIKHLFPQPLEELGSFLEMTLRPLGFIHPCVLYARMGPYSQWDGKPFKERVRWWRDLTELAAYFLTRCDEEQQRLIRAVEAEFGCSLAGAGTLHGKIVDQYSSSIEDPRTLLSTFRTCSAFQSFIPMVEQEDGSGYLFKMDHPGVHEDVYYGLSFLLEMAHRLNVTMPHIAEIYKWTVGFLGGEKPSALEYFPRDWPKLERAA